MEYAYKPTTHGRAVMAACMSLEKPLKISRVAFGSGKVDEAVNLADVHELLEFVSDGAVADRSHKDDRFFLTIQYANKAHPKVKTFMLSEFIIYVENPETGEETDLLYGTLGDYRQPVPAYNPAYSPSVFNFPLELILSDEINVSVAAPSGLVVHDELITIILRHSEDHQAHQDIRQEIEDIRRQLGGGIVRAERIELTIPATGWEADGDTGGECPFHRDIPHARITEDAVPVLTVVPTSLGTASACALCQSAQTLPGVLRVYAKTIPAAEINTELLLLGDVRGLKELIIPVTGWEADEDTGGRFPLHVDIADETITEDLVPMLTVLPGSLAASGLCGMSSSARTLDGALRVYAKTVPTVPVSAQLTLLGGSYQGGSADGYILPAATAYTLGGVKVRSGSGLTVDSGGNLAIDAADSSAVEELFNGSNG